MFKLIDVFVLFFIHKIITRLFAILLFYSILVNSTGYAGMFPFFLTKLKKKIKITIKNIFNDQKLDFLYGNNLYNVMIKKVNDGYIHICRINDIKEQVLYKILNKISGNNLNSEGIFVSSLIQQFNKLSNYFIYITRFLHLFNYIKIKYNDIFKLLRYNMSLTFKDPPSEFDLIIVNGYPLALKNEICVFQ